MVEMAIYLEWWGLDLGAMGRGRRDGRVK